MFLGGFGRLLALSTCGAGGAAAAVVVLGGGTLRAVCLRLRLH